MIRLGDVVDMTFGYAFKSREFTESPDDVRLLRGDNIGQGRLRWDNARRFPVDRVADVENYRLSLGDVVVAMDRPWISAGLKYAVVREADVPSLLVQRVARLRARDGLDQGYLSAIIGSKAFTDYVVGVQTGSAVPHISGGQIAGFELPTLPPIDEQRTIAATLGALDDKIESNRRTIDLVEKLADQHFASAAETTVGLTEVAALTMGSSPPGDTYNEDGQGHPFYQGVRDFGRRFPRRRVWTTGAVRLAEANDTLVSVRAPVGDLNRARETCCIGRGVAAVRSESHPSTLYYALRASEDTWEPFQQEGTVFGSINKSDLSKARLPWPGAAQVHGLESVLDLLDEQISSATTQNERLNTLRDTLLPEFLSGRTRLPEMKAG